MQNAECLLLCNLLPCTDNFILDKTTRGLQQILYNVNPDRLAIREIFETFKIVMEEFVANIPDLLHMRRLGGLLICLLPLIYMWVRKNCTDNYTKEIVESVNSWDTYLKKQTLDTTGQCRLSADMLHTVRRLVSDLSKKIRDNGVLQMKDYSASLGRASENSTRVRILKLFTRLSFIEQHVSILLALNLVGIVYRCDQ